MYSATLWTKTVVFYQNAEFKNTCTEAANSSHYIACCVYKDGRLASQYLYYELVSVDPYHAPLGNAGLYKCLQITIFLK